MNTLRLSRSLLSRAVPLHSARSALPSRRGLHASRPWRAAEDTSGFMSKLENTKLFRQLADKPEALNAIAAFGEMLHNKGAFVYPHIESRRPKDIPKA
jgi:hypothetical protein